MVKTIIPSSTLKSKYLQRHLKTGSVFIDPTNHFKYIVEEQLLSGGILTKVAKAYFGLEEGVELVDVPDSVRQSQSNFESKVKVE